MSAWDFLHSSARLTARFDRGTVARYAKLLSTAVLLVVVFLLIDVGRLLAALRGVDVGLFLASVALAIVGITISAKKWHLLLRSKGERQRFLETFRIYYVGKFLNLALPSTIGGDAVKAYSMSQQVDRGVEAYSSIFMDRFTGLVALAGFAVLGYLFRPSLFTWRLVVPLVVLVAGTVGVVLYAFNGVGARQLNAVLRYLPADVDEKVERLRTSIQLYRDQPRYVALALALALTFQLIPIVNRYILLEALGLEVPLSFLFVMVPITEVILFLPISIQGYGAREALYVFFLLEVGIAAEQAVALAVLVHLQALLSASVGSVGLVRS